MNKHCDMVRPPRLMSRWRAAKKIDFLEENDVSNEKIKARTILEDGVWVYCPICSKVFANFARLNAHIAYVHQREPVPIKCSDVSPRIQISIKAPILNSNENKPGTSSSSCNKLNETKLQYNICNPEQRSRPANLAVYNYGRFRNEYVIDDIEDSILNPDDVLQAEWFVCCICNDFVCNKNDLENHFAQKHPGKPMAFKDCLLDDSSDDDDGDDGCVEVPHSLIVNKSIRKLVDNVENQLDLEPSVGSSTNNKSLIEVVGKDATPSNCKLFKCQLCTKSYKTVSDLRQHAQKHFSFHFCGSCVQCFRRTEELAEHISKHSKFYIQLKPRRFIRQEVIQTFAANQNLTCSKCKKKFTDIRYLNEHIKYEHKRNKYFECPFCAETFPKRKNLQVHIVTHRDKIKYSCVECEREFNSIAKSVKALYGLPEKNDEAQSHSIHSSRMKNPMLDLTTRSNILAGVAYVINNIVDVYRNAYYCKICSKRFKSKVGLIEHNCQTNTNATVQEVARISTNKAQTHNRTANVIQESENAIQLLSNTVYHVAEILFCDYCGILQFCSHDLDKHIVEKHGDNNASQQNIAIAFNKMFNSLPDSAIQDERKIMDATYDDFEKQSENIAATLQRIFNICKICNRLSFGLLNYCAEHVDRIFTDTPYYYKDNTASEEIQKALNEFVSKFIAEIKNYFADFKSCQKCNIVIIGRQKFYQHLNIEHDESSQDESNADNTGAIFKGIIEMLSHVAVCMLYRTNATQTIAQKTLAEKRNALKKSLIDSLGDSSEKHNSKSDILKSLFITALQFSESGTLVEKRYTLLKAILSSFNSTNGKNVSEIVELSETLKFNEFDTLVEKRYSLQKTIINGLKYTNGEKTRKGVQPSGRSILTTRGYITLQYKESDTLADKRNELQKIIINSLIDTKIEDITKRVQSSGKLQLNESDTIAEKRDGLQKAIINALKRSYEDRIATNKWSLQGHLLNTGGLFSLRVEEINILARKRDEIQKTIISSLKATNSKNVTKHTWLFNKHLFNECNYLPLQFIKSDTLAEKRDILQMNIIREQCLAQEHLLNTGGYIPLQNIGSGSLVEKRDAIQKAILNKLKDTNEIKIAKKVQSSQDYVPLQFKDSDTLVEKRDVLQRFIINNLKYSKEEIPAQNKWISRVDVLNTCRYVQLQFIKSDTIAEKRDSLQKCIINSLTYTNEEKIIKNTWVSEKDVLNTSLSYPLEFIKSDILAEKRHALQKNIINNIKDTKEEKMKKNMWLSQNNLLNTCRYIQLQFIKSDTFAEKRETIQNNIINNLKGINTNAEKAAIRCPLSQDSPVTINTYNGDVLFQEAIINILQDVPCSNTIKWKGFGHDAKVDTSDQKITELDFSVCQICNELTPSANQFNEHMRIHHIEYNERDSFPQSNKQWWNSSSHLFSSGTVQSSQGRIENASQNEQETINLGRENRLPLHMLNTLFSKINKMFSCYICRQKFTSKKKLLNHGNEKHPIPSV